MKKDLIDTIMEKEYHALTAAEREELKSFCESEDEYNQMKEVFIGVEGMTWDNPAPKAETKQRLDELFDSTYPKAAPVWYSSVLTVVAPKDKPIHRQPLAQIAAIALLVLLTVPFWSSEVVPAEQPPQMASNEVLAPDTQEENNEVRTVSKDPGTAEVDVENKTNSSELTASPLIIESESETNDARLPVLETTTALTGVGAASGGTMNTFSSSAPITVDIAFGASSDLLIDPNVTHPDGVFIAVSQPTSETPEMLDLLTATF